MRMFGGERVTRARDEVLLLAKINSSSEWVDELRIIAVISGELPSSRNDEGLK